MCHLLVQGTVTLYIHSQRLVVAACDSKYWVRSDFIWDKVTWIQTKCATFLSCVGIVLFTSLRKQS